MLIKLLFIFSNLFSTLTNLPATWVERSIENSNQRSERLANLVPILKKYSTKDQAAIIAIGYEESTFAEYTLFDCEFIPTKANGDCDKGLSKTYWQLQKRTCPQLWNIKSGSKKALEIAIECVVRQWHFALRTCKRTDWAFSQYGGIGCRSSKNGNKKNWRYHLLLERL